MIQRRTAIWAATLLAIGAASASASADPRLDEAQRLLNAGDANAALVLLEEQVAQRAGDVQFDYLLAVAMLDSGEPSQALLAFERVLALQPDFHGARMDYARALFATGRLDEAKAEFETVAQHNPPPAAQRALDDFLGRIERRQRQLRFSRYLNANVRSGYDSNVNSATALDEFLGFQLNERSRESSSGFFEFGVKGGAAWQPQAGLVLDGRLALRRRVNPDASFADSDVVVGGIGLRQYTGTQRRSLTLQAFRLDVDGRENNSALTLAGSWSLRVRPRWWLGGSADVTAVRYGDELVIKDINQYAVGLLASYSSGGPGNLSARLRVGRDAPRLSESRFERSFVAATLGLDWRFSPTLSGALSVSLEDSDFDAVFFAQAYDAPRSDLTVRSRAVADWRFAQHWRLQPGLSYVSNDTDVEIFDFERFEFGVGVSYLWQ